jgi:hypothetical protein
VRDKASSVVPQVDRVELASHICLWRAMARVGRTGAIDYFLIIWIGIGTSPIRVFDEYGMRMDVVLPLPVALLSVMPHPSPRPVSSFFPARFLWVKT